VAASRCMRTIVSIEDDVHPRFRAFSASFFHPLHRNAVRGAFFSTIIHGDFLVIWASASLPSEVCAVAPRSPVTAARPAHCFREASGRDRSEQAAEEHTVLRKATVPEGAGANPATPQTAPASRTDARNLDIVRR